MFPLFQPQQRSSSRSPFSSLTSVSYSTSPFSLHPPPAPPSQPLPHRVCTITSFRVQQHLAAVAMETVAQQQVGCRRCLGAWHLSHPLLLSSHSRRSLVPLSNPWAKTATLVWMWIRHHHNNSIHKFKSVHVSNSIRGESVQVHGAPIPIWSITIIINHHQSDGTILSYFHQYRLQNIFLVFFLILTDYMSLTEDWCCCCTANLLLWLRGRCRLGVNIKRVKASHSMELTGDEEREIWSAQIFQCQPSLKFILNYCVSLVSCLKAFNS